MHQKKQWIALAISLALSQAAWAQDGGDDRFKLSGFGTLGVTHSTEDQADVTPYVLNTPYSRCREPGVRAR